MGQPVVHFEVIGKDPAGLRGYYGEMFGWEFDTSSPVSDAVSEPVNYGFVERNTTSDGVGIAGGVNAGADLAIGHFTDPEGHLIGIAGPA